MAEILLGLLAALLIFALLALMAVRLILAAAGGKEKENQKPWGISQTSGSREIQADQMEILSTKAGVLGILADGIGKANTGRISAQIALDTAADAYEPYQRLTNPEYFFRTVFREANLRIQKTIGERRGGACLGIAYMGGGFLHYGVAGDVRIIPWTYWPEKPMKKGKYPEKKLSGAWKKNAAGIMWGWMDFTKLNCRTVLYD